MSRLGERFVLEREIGEGGMARVFLGRDEVLDRPVAVKILRSGFGVSKIGARFRREGRTAARLSHPNIVQVYDAGEDELEGREVSFIVMEYVSGGDLKRLVDQRGPLAEKELARIGADVASGLAHAHQKGIVHRDVKPQNILIDEYGRPKLTDFGIARALDATAATQTGSYLGTALYSSPEQLQGEKVTTKSDIYSLGMTLYQAAVGEAPFTGAPIAVASQHISRVPTAPSDLGARLGDEVEALILDCVNKDPGRRPTAEEVRERLLDAGGAVRPARVQAPPPAPETSREAERTLSPEGPSATLPPDTEPPTIERTRATTPGTPLAGPPPEGMRREGDRGRAGRGPILAAAALLLVVLGVAVALATLGGETTQSSSGENEQASSSGEEEGQYASSAGGEETTSAQEQTAQESPTGEEGNDVEAAAAQAVEDFYASAAGGNYERSSSLLTVDWRQRHFPSQADFEGTFATLERVRFAAEPEVQVSDGTATVTGETIAEHTDRIERNRGTWTLVNDNGEWRISGWTVNNISTQRA